MQFGEPNTKEYTPQIPDAVSANTLLECTFLANINKSIFLEKVNYYYC